MNRMNEQMTPQEIERRFKVMASELEQMREKIALLEERCEIRHECDVIDGKDIPSIRELYIQHANEVRL